MQQDMKHQEAADKKNEETNTEAVLSITSEDKSDSAEEEEAKSSGQGSSEEGKELTMVDRKKKLDELRSRMHESSRANRQTLIAESTERKLTAKEAARREKQIKLAETLRLKADAEERGEDTERNKNWEWTIEENDEWERKKKRKKRNADFEFHDEEQRAHRRYKKDLVHLKPDLASYNKQKELALGLAPGALASSSDPVSSSGSSSLTNFNPQGGSVVSYEQQQAAEALYRDANTLLYADNKPSEDAIDRVIGKLNQEQDKRNKFSRKRINEVEGDITYINERNRVFNKKIARYYDAYTSEIRANFERGTAL